MKEKEFAQLEDGELLSPITEEEQRIVDLFAGLMVDRYFATIEKETVINHE